MNKYVVFWEPGIWEGSHTKVYVPILSAIGSAKESARQVGRMYKTDSQALADFITTHWGYIEEVDGIPK